MRPLVARRRRAREHLVDEHLYLFCTTPSPWPPAVGTCASIGYALVSIADAAENDFVSTTASAVSTDRWWIGLNDIVREGVLVWQGGGPTTYTPWEPGEPNNNSSNEDCGQINRYYPDTTWNDEPCQNELFFVREER